MPQAINKNQELEQIRAEFAKFSVEYKKLAQAQEKLTNEYLKKVEQIMASRLIKKIKQ